jgi:branched-chain amino acid transport system ATP-binding protein
MPGTEQLLEEARAPLLEVCELAVSFGPIQALRGVSLRVSKGEIAAILGANGAGKTSLLRAVSRLIPCAGGSIRFEGRDLARLAPHAVVRLGMAHCLEGRRLFPELTVAENLDLGAYILADPQRREANRALVFGIFPVLKERARQSAGTLSGGEQQMLALGRALMSSPRLLLLDEPSLGLGPLIIDQLFGILRRLNREQGVTVLLVEQNANEALQLADRAYILEQGRIALEGPAAQLREDERVKAASLGL